MTDAPMPPSPPHPAPSYKNAATAAVLSAIFMGLGQLYNGQSAKGVIFMMAYAMSLILLFSHVFSIIGIFTTPALFVYGMYDAYRSSEKINFDRARRAGKITSGHEHTP